MKRLTVAVTLLLSLVAVGGGAGAGEATAACTLAKSTAYDNPADADADGSLFVDTAQQVAQSFKVPSAITLHSATLYLQNVGATADSVSVGIHSDTGGQPGALLGAERTRNLTNTSYAFAEFDFSTDNIVLAAGTTYYIVATNTSPNPTGYQWAGDSSSSTYPDGQTFYSLNDGASWSNVPTGTYDQLFRVSVQTCTADVQPGSEKQKQTQTNKTPAVSAASQLAFSNTTFAAESSGPSAYGAKRKAPFGTKISFTLNEAATVRFTVTRRAKGRKVNKGKKTVCAKPTRKNRKRTRCTRVVTLKGSFSRNGVAGKNSFHFTGRLRGKKLKPGRYRLVATPTAGGKKGKPTSSGFRIVP
jgi:hypothetical protein